MRASPTDRPERILIGVGANLPSVHHGSPQATCAAALEALRAAGVRTVKRSRWYESAPVPPSDQPWFVNGVAQVACDFSPKELLDVLHSIEREFGRERRAVNAARVIDLDLLAYGDRLNEGPEPPLLPHPRLHERAFVLLPLAEIAPDWRHPATGETLASLTEKLPPEQVARPLGGEAGPVFFG